MGHATALYERHVKAGAKMAPYAGFMMPIQYPTGVIAEHTAVRTAAGLFDVSHMGVILAEGHDALAFLQRLICNDITDMAGGEVRYSPLLNENGGIIDDTLVGCLHPGLYGVIVNAANAEKDFAWMKRQRFGDTALYNISRDISILAVQGPRSETILKRLADTEDLPAKYYTFSSWISIAGTAAFVSRTGYTGEDGFEIYVSKHFVAGIWDALLESSRDCGLIPCGLGARDTLRMEAAMPLYGHELTEDITPIEAGLNRFVKMGKGDFIGRAALAAAGKPSRHRVGLKMTGRGIAREGCAIYAGNEPIGRVTSGTYLPTMGYPGALALIDATHRSAGTTVDVDIRGRRVAAEVVRLPFYNRFREITRANHLSDTPGEEAYTPAGH
ncbi:MAG: glycine cleavage system aminomethyltransferase GcvT [Oscillospiraceae bacterium]|nr:glycine cleavage system aminomethyltransferase GcvT [Oscillospiraceae bacterium]